MLELTPQAMSVFVIGTLASGASVVLSPDKKLGVAIGCAVFAATCYQTYLTNCTVKGKCKILAWFLVALNVIVYLALIRYRLNKST